MKMVSGDFFSSYSYNKILIMARKFYLSLLMNIVFSMNELKVDSWLLILCPTYVY